MKSLNEPKQGFWGVLTRKAKAIIDDDNASKQHETPGRTTPQMSGRAMRGQVNFGYQNDKCVNWLRIYENHLR